MGFAWRPHNKMAELGPRDKQLHLKLCIVVVGEVQTPRTLKPLQAKFPLLPGHIRKRSISVREGEFNFNNATLFRQQSVQRSTKPGLVMVDHQPRGTNPWGISTVNAEHSVCVGGDCFMVPTILHRLCVDVVARDDGLHQAGGIGSFAQAQDRMGNGCCDSLPPFCEPQRVTCLAGGCESQGCCLGSINCNILVVPQGRVVCGRWRLVPPRQPWCLQHIPSLQPLFPCLLSKEMAASNQQQATHSWSANHVAHYSVCSHTASTAQGLCTGGGGGGDQHLQWRLQPASPWMRWGHHMVA